MLEENTMGKSKSGHYSYGAYIPEGNQIITLNELHTDTEVLKEQKLVSMREYASPGSQKSPQGKDP